MLKAKDIMKRDVVTIHSSASLRDISRLLAEHRIIGIPVVDDDKRLVGMISMRDIIREEVRTLGAMPDYQDVYELFSSAMDMEEAESISVRRLWVEEIMSRDLHTAVESTPVREICAMMNKFGVHRIPILRDERLVGLVTAMDIIKTLANGQDI